MASAIVVNSCTTGMLQKGGVLFGWKKNFYTSSRSDYKFGWQLEREVDQGTYHESDDEKYVVSSDDDDLTHTVSYTQQTQPTKREV